MSLLGKLKDLVIVDESADQRAAADASTDRAAPAIPDPVPSNVSPATQPGAAACADQPGSPDLEKQIDGVIQGAPAFAPFKAFIRMADNMKGKVPDEAQRYQAVQAATETSLDTLLAALDSHAKVLDSEAANFKASVVVKTEADIASLAAQEKKLTQQIATLSAQLSTLSAQKDDLSRQVIARKSGLDKLKIDFDAARATLGQRYGDYAAKLNNYLGASGNGQ